MASVSISQLIIFIAALTVSVAVATTLTANVTEISHAIDQRGGGVAEKIETDVEIISDPGSPSSIYNDSAAEVTLLVKNTGQKTLYPEADQLDVLIDGEYGTITNVTVVGEPAAEEWRRGDVVEVTISQSLDPGTTRVVAHVNGDDDTLVFRVP